MNPCSNQPSFPSQNPNPNFPIPSLPQNTNPNCPCSLSTTLSSLTSLLSLSRQTLNSHSTLTESLNSNLVSCPFNPNHLLPPESLFSHSLHCPSTQSLNLDLPNYRNTLKTPSNLHSQDTLFEDKQCSELCLSLDDYFSDFGSNFFYKDCPGVVNLLDVDNYKKTFTLPGFLSVECVNFEGFKEGESKASEKKGLGVLASGLWETRREVERWVDYPASYSFNVVCGILGWKMVKRSDFRKWVVSNSPWYGIVIDEYMGDHIVLLVRLCLKAVVREAIGLVEVGMEYGEAEEKGSDVNLEMRMFECPVLLQVLIWLGSQLSVLYGEVNGKFFVINMIKQCILEGASRLLLFPSEEKVTVSLKLGQESQSLDANGVKEIKHEEPIEQSNEPVETVDETIGVGVIFVSQVAAAVAALHERCFLEEKIKRLRFSQPLSRYERMLEHAYVSERADAERKKLPNYRPIIDHDGLPRQASSNEGTSRTKTREEILAEERDYKRRRMSYRGKKLKRTTLQVMRDIIEEYTEEIKKAGGIGCFVKGTEEEGFLLSDSPVTYDHAVDADEHRKGTSNISESARGSPNHQKRRSHYDQHTRSTNFEDSSQNDFEQSRWFEHHDLEDARRSINKEKHREEYHSGISKRHRSHGLSDDRRSRRRERDDAESTRAMRYESGRRSNISKYKDHKSSYSVSNSSDDFRLRRDDQKLDIRDRNRRSSYENQTSGSRAQNGFDDRYNPSESDDMFEDDVGKYVRPE
ncbi:U11/U12 small nuclear ribonucleoprotein 48 kDa protein [Durio zibethinus]|uniref:U11/U12 small nuclear ribonucleoprotein 48 kDa protein n=1 Tax=Durio zibethinus TaxID=66656 RepID=A0A6P5Z2W6_DURZI|nr:U11/U12 small nuclear ribonucleoprotein 48 kDa protein [Durio zibethinus]